MEPQRSSNGCCKRWIRAWGEAGYRAVDTVIKDGFETSIPCDKTDVWERYVRVAAFDKNGTVLGMSKKLDIDYTDVSHISA